MSCAEAGVEGVAAPAAAAEEVLRARAALAPRPPQPAVTAISPSASMRTLIPLIPRIPLTAGLCPFRIRVLSVKLVYKRMLFEALFKHADQQPHQAAVIDDSGTYDWQQFAAAAAGLGMYLSFQTDRPRVGLLLPASMGFAASFYGTLLAGKTVVPINFLLGDREVQHVIADSGIDTIVTIPQLAQRLGA